MTQNAEVKFVGDAAQLLQEYQKLRRAEAEEIDALKKIKEEARRTAREQMQMLREGQKETEKSETALERYNRQQQRLKELLDKGAISQETYNRRVGQLRNELRGVGTEVSKATGGAGELAAQFLGIATTAGVLLTTLRLVTGEMESQKKMQEQAANKQLSFGQALRGTLINFQGDETLSEGDLVKAIEQVAAEARTSPEEVANVMSSAFSAKGSLSNEVAVDAVRDAFRLTPGDAGAAEQLSSRALDIAKSTGIEDTQAIIGFMMNLQANSRITQLDKIGATAVPAIISTTTAGDTVEQAGEVFATLNQMMADAEGNMSRTATIALSQQLKEFFPSGSEGKFSDQRGGFIVPEDQMQRFESAGSTTERIAIMQQSPELRRAFLSKSSFEKAAQAPVEQLLSGSETALSMQRAAQAGILPVDDAASRAYTARVQQLDDAEFQSGVAFKQRAMTAGDLQNLRERERGTAGIVREALFGEEGILARVDTLGPDVAFDTAAEYDFSAGLAAGKDPIEMGQTLLRNIEASTPFSAPSSSEKQAIADLRESLERLREATERNTNETRRQVGKNPTDALNRRD